MSTPAELPVSQWHGTANADIEPFGFEETFSKVFCDLVIDGRTDINLRPDQQVFAHTAVPAAIKEAQNWYAVIPEPKITFTESAEAPAPVQTDTRPKVVDLVEARKRIAENRNAIRVGGYATAAALMVFGVAGLGYPALTSHDRAPAVISATNLQRPEICVADLSTIVSGIRINGKLQKDQTITSQICYDAAAIGVMYNESNANIPVFNANNEITGLTTGTQAHHTAVIPPAHSGTK